MNLSYSQCKAIHSLHDPYWREVIDAINDQPEWLCYADALYNTEGDGQPSYPYPTALNVADILAVQQGGCESGAFMPAVTYWTALDTMNRYGDDVLQYVEDVLGELPDVSGQSWARMACTYVSAAVELWCGQFDLDGVPWD